MSEVYKYNGIDDEYNKKMSEYAIRLSDPCNDEWDELYEKVSKYQQNYMDNILKDYEKTIDCEAKEHKTCLYSLY